MADTRGYLMQRGRGRHRTSGSTRFRNCGKGQPMQTKKLGNGGPTMRSRARLAGG